MKILLITGTFRPSINGVAISTDILSKNLIKLGHKVLVLAPYNNEVTKDGKEILRYPSVGNPFIPDYPVPLLPLTPVIFERIKKFKPDVVHAHHPFHIGFSASFISRQLKIPLVFTYHTKHDYYAKKYFKFLPKEARGEFVQNSVLDFCKKCNLVIAPSKDIEIFLNKKGISKTSTVPTIVDDLQKSKLSKKDLRKKLRLPLDKKALLFVGRLALEKNVNLIIDSMLKIPSNFILVVCGTGPLENKIKEKIKDLNLGSRIYLVGKVERKELSLYYSAADYFYYSSRSETQGLIYWEALSFGLPVISVESDVAREWVKDGVGLLSKNDATKMAEGVKEISKLNYELLSKNALNFSKKFSSKKTALKMVEEYKKIT